LKLTEDEAFSSVGDLSSVCRVVGGVGGSLGADVDSSAPDVFNGHMDL